MILLEQGVCSRMILLEQRVRSHCSAFKAYPFCDTVISVCVLSVIPKLVSLPCSYTHAHTTVFNSPALLSPSAYSPLSSQVPVLSRSNTKPFHLLSTAQHPLPGPTPCLELPRIPSSELSERSPLHLPFIIVFSLTFLSLKLYT